VYGDTFILNTKTLSWIKLTTNGDIPKPMGSMVSCTLGNLFLTACGWYGRIDGIDRGCFTDIYCLDTETMTWQKKRNVYNYLTNIYKGFVPTHRCGSASCFLGGKWYIFGGINTDVGHEILQDVTILEPELKKKEGI